MKLLLLPAVLFISSFANAVTLQQAIDTGMGNSPKLQMMASQSREQSAKRLEAYSGFLPNVSAGATYLTNKNYLLTDVTLGGSQITIPQIIPTSNFTLTASLPLFDGFSNINRLSSASHFEDAAALDLQWSKFQIEREITLQYFRAVAAKTLKTVAEQNVKTLEDHLKDVSLFKKSGLSTNYDVLRVEVQLSEARSELMNSADNMVLARGRLAESMGVEEVDEVVGDLPNPATQKKELTLASLQSRGDLKAMSEKTIGFDKLQSASDAY